jgi:ATP-dependent protease HslVU (ClpYQ) peptidase subunit
MTTIVFDGHVLVADTQVTMDGVKCAKTDKIECVRWGSNVIAGDAAASKTCYLAISGDIGDAAAIVEALEAGTAEDTLLTGHTLGILVNSKDFRDVTEVYSREINGTFYCKLRRSSPAELPFVAGSGGLFALAAMKAGATPYKAVEIACEMDIRSSLPLTYITPDMEHFL